MKQTNQIKYHRNEKQQAWNTSVKQCALGERAGLNQKNFQIFFHHASQYRLVHNAYYALLNDYREVCYYQGCQGGENYIFNLKRLIYVFNSE